MGQIHKNQKLIFVTGKGGVGKTLVSTALALNIAKKGQKTLLVELGETSFLSRVYNKEIGYAPTELEEGLEVVLLSGENALKEFISYYIRVPAVVELFFENRVMKTVVKTAPALKELAVLGKITSGIRGIGPDFPYDVVVVDAYATGHFLALIGAPKGMAEAIRMGPMGDQSRKIDSVIHDKSNTSCVVVTIPEELPTVESAELIERLQKDKIPNVSVIANKWWPEISHLNEAQSWAKSSGNQGFETFLTHSEKTNERQQKSDQIINKLKVPITYLPFVFMSSAREKIRELAKLLEKA